MTIPLEILRTILLHNGVDGRTLAGVTADLERWQHAQDEAVAKLTSEQHVAAESGTFDDWVRNG